MEKAVKYLWLLQKGFVHFEAQQQRALKPIVMCWCFQIRFLRIIPVQLPSGDWQITQLLRSPNWMEDWFTRQGHWAVRQYGMAGIIKAGKFPVESISL